MDEYTKKISHKQIQLWHFLQAIPICELSDKAYRNYAKRFGLEESIFRALVDLEREKRMKGGANV